MRKMQEDNEFRFQEIEQRRQTPACSRQQVRGDQRPQAVDTAAAEEEVHPALRGTVASRRDGTGDPAEVPSEPATAARPADFGTITFDKDGNMTGATRRRSPCEQATGSGNSAGSRPGAVAALPATDDPEELYRNSYEFILSGDYGTAEEGFRNHISRFPSDPKAADAHFWLGEALLGQKNFVTRPSLSWRPTRTIRLPRKRPTCS